MEDMLIMSKKELERKTLLEAYICGKLDLAEVAARMGVCYRQAKRIWARYRKENDKGLQHRSRGKKPFNAYSGSFREQVLGIYQKKYMEFGPTFATEKLLEDDGIVVHRETLRLWLKAEGLWHRKRKHKIYRERRERRASFGELLQIDGSIHKWFDGNDAYYCLLNMVDDATGICLARLDTGEKTQVLLATLKQWIMNYGVPKAVYVDLKSVYVGAKKLKEKYDDDLLIQEGFSVFEQVCKELNIQIIRAYSAQAKGRVERKHAVFQDRFVKDLKLYGIKSVDDANNYLKKFLVKINNKFAKSKEEVSDLHRDKNLYGDLDQILCWRYKRQLRNDWTIQFKRDYYQLKSTKAVTLKPKVFITIKRHLNGAMRFWFDETELEYYKLGFKPEPPSKSKRYYKLKGPANPTLLSKNSRKNKTRSPWNQFNPNWLKSA